MCYATHPNGKLLGLWIGAWTEVTALLSHAAFRVKSRLETHLFDSLPGYLLPPAGPAPPLSETSTTLAPMSRFARKIRVT